MVSLDKDTIKDINQNDSQTELENRYNFKEIETNWQEKWNKIEAFKTIDKIQSKENCFIAEMWPYPSGQLHMGHLRNYVIGDTLAYYKKMNGYNVLHTIGWDAFGLPAENAAMERNISPSVWTDKNIQKMKTEIQSIGCSYDWDREVKTCSPDYYQKEQQIFLDLLANDLVYRKKSEVNWDPVDKTVLANEQVINGKGWRSGATVEKKLLTQWFARISQYAPKLLKNLDSLKGNWPSAVVHMQEKWIGKSEGLEIKFLLNNDLGELTIYTTRPETIFGAVCCVIAPDHELVKQNKVKLGEKKQYNKNNYYETNAQVYHPFIKDLLLPVYASDYVLADYATGAIFAVPAHNEMDFHLSQLFNLEVKQVVFPVDGAVEELPYLDNGILKNSDFLNGKNLQEARLLVSEMLVNNDQANKTIKYNIRDWGLSRQRYWGCPIPIIHCKNCGIVPNKDLPVKLPLEITDLKNSDWKHIICPVCKADAEKETDTLDTFFDSSWYFLHYADKNLKNCNDWLPVDYYIGGIEHAILHLLYARFFYYALQDCGYNLKGDFPFKRLITQGMVCHKTYQLDKESISPVWLYPEDVFLKSNDQYFTMIDGEELPVKIGRSEKMSKSKKNLYSPANIIDCYGADTARLFMLSDSPIERDLEWNDNGIKAIYNYLVKLWSFFINLNNKLSLSADNSGAPALIDIKKKLNNLVLEVTKKIDELHFNKAIALLRTFINLFQSTTTKIAVFTDEDKKIIRETISTLLKLWFPFINHITSELWKQCGFSGDLILEEWPKYDAKISENNILKIAVQLNGKFIGTLEVPTSSSEEYILNQAHKVFEKKLLNKVIEKSIFIKNKVLNFLVKK